MADVALWSGATGAGDGSSWDDAYTTIGAVIAAQGSLPTRVFVASDHSELVAASVTFPAGGTLLYQLISCDRTSGYPPTAEQAGARIGSTSGTNLTLFNSFYSKGIFWTAGEGSTATRNLVFDSTASNNTVRIVGGGIELKNTASASRVSFGTGATNRNTKFKFENIEIRFGNSGQGLNLMAASLVIRDGALAGAAITQFIKSFSTVVADVEVTGFDMQSAATSMNLIANSVLGAGTVLFDRIRVPSGWTGGLMQSTQTNAALRAIAKNVDSGDTNYRQASVGYSGSMREETTFVRTGGAAIGSTPISWRASTSSQYYPLSAFECPPIEWWNDTVGSPVTVTFHTLTEGVTLKDDEAWVEVTYFDSSGNPLGGVVSDERSNQLSPGVDQDASSAEWTTTDITSPVKQKLSVTITPQKAGTIRAVVKIARSSSSVFICPRPEIS